MRKYTDEMGFEISLFDDIEAEDYDKEVPKRVKALVASLTIAEAKAALLDIAMSMFENEGSTWYCSDVVSIISEADRLAAHHAKP